MVNSNGEKINIITIKFSSSHLTKYWRRAVGCETACPAEVNGQHDAHAALGPGVPHRPRRLEVRARHARPCGARAMKPNQPETSTAQEAAPNPDGAITYRGRRCDCGMCAREFHGVNNRVKHSNKGHCRPAVARSAPAAGSGSDSGVSSSSSAHTEVGGT